VRLAGDLIGEVDERGEPLAGDTLLLLLSAHHEPVAFTLPAAGPGYVWERLFDTADPRASPAFMAADGPYNLQGRSVVLLRTQRIEPTETPGGTAANVAAPAPAPAQKT
jgi:glycogen operon protein